MSDASDDPEIRVSRLERRLERERAARRQAEKLLEDKSLELYERNQQLQAESAERIKAEKAAARAQERARSQAALEESKARLQAIFDHAVDGIIVISADGRIEAFNPAAERLFGYAANEILGHNVKELMPEPYAHEHDGYLHSYLTTGERKIIGIGREVVGRRADASEFPMELAVSEIRIGEERRFTGLVRDISERKRNEQALAELNQSLTEQVEQTQRAMDNLKNAQNQLVQAEKLASLGELVAGVAHEINTPIGISVTAASLLRDEVKTVRELVETGKLKRSTLDEFAETSSQTAEMILSNLARAADLIQSFKQVAVDRSTTDQRDVVLAQFLDEILLSLKPRLRKTSHQVTMDCDGDIRIRTQPGALAQVITNLVMNSLTHGLDDAVPGKISLQVEPGENGVALDYRDNGRGISAEVLPRIFDPFFTTRRGSGGTGLGLHIVYNLITSTLGGQINVASTPGDGVQFHIHLPWRLASNEDETQTP